MSVHVVQQGECLIRIARQYGFLDFRTVYEDAANAALRKKRPDPNLLYPGDTVVIPDKRQKMMTGATGQRHRFQIPGLKRMLRLVIEDVSGKKMAAAPYELTIDGDTRRGVIGGDGLIEHEIPFEATSAVLTVTYTVDDLTLAGHTATPVQGQYVWPLDIAHLNPVERADDKGVSGYQARLRNMGYDPGPIDGLVGPRTRAAVSAFQEDNPPLVVDGICGPATRAKLVELYGC